ncbi:hypothetical protein K6025_05490 [Ehrlichia sp. JZT12]
MHNIRTDNLKSTISYLTERKSLSLLLILISHNYNTPRHNSGNYQYYRTIMLHDEEVYKQIRDTEKKKIRALLRLWIESLTDKILLGINIPLEDKIIIEQKIHKTIEDNKSLLSEYPNDNIKDKLFQEFAQNITKSKLTEKLKANITETSSNVNLLNRYKKELMEDIASMIHDPDGISLLACHGITTRNSTTPNTLLSKEIKRLYQDTIGIDPEFAARNIFHSFPQQHTARMIWDTIKIAHRKLKSREDSIEKFTVVKYPWYSIINNIKKMINNSLFIKSRLEKERRYIDKIRDIFKTSISYGDTALFFEELKKIQYHQNIHWNPLHTHTNLVIKELINLESQTQYKTIKDFIADIQYYDNIKPSIKTIVPDTRSSAIISTQSKKKNGIKKLIKKMKTVFKSSSKKKSDLKEEGLDVIDGISIASWDPFTSSHTTDSSIPAPKLESISQALVDEVCNTR